MTFVGVCANAAPVVLDFSRSHLVEDLNASGLRVTKIAGGLRGQAYSFQDQEVEIRLPARRTVVQKIVLGTIDTQDGKLTDLSMYGDVMAHDQVVQAVHMFHESFGLRLATLSQWDVQNRGKIRNGEPYSISANLHSCPRVSIGIELSMNGLYPWVIGLSLSWEWDKQRDWNEERAWRELPPPAIELISLNPPSGQKYKRRDAYKDTLEAQKRFEQEQAVKRVASTPAIVPTGTAPPATNLFPATPKATPAVRAQSASIVLWPWLMGIAALVIIVTVILKRHT